MSSTNMIKILPGDTLIVRLPKSQPRQNITCSVRVLDQKAEKSDHFVGQVIDMVLLTKGPMKLSPGEITEIPKAHIVSVIPSTVDDIKSELTIEISSGTISSLWRTDGKIEPINVRIIDRDLDMDQLFKVDAISSESLTPTKYNSEMPMFPEMGDA